MKMSQVHGVSQVLKGIDCARFAAADFAAITQLAPLVPLKGTSMVKYLDSLVFTVHALRSIAEPAEKRGRSFQQYFNDPSVQK